MAYDQHLADRVSRILRDRGKSFEEKKMMGGLCYMVDDKMCVGVHQDRLMVRLDPDSLDEHLKKPGAAPMDFTGRPMKGFLFIYGEGYDKDRDLEHWIDLALAYNPLARASKKRKK